MNRSSVRFRQAALCVEQRAFGAGEITSRPFGLRYLRSFRLVGGDATVRASRGLVELISATPSPGFVMTVMPSGADRAVVNFTGGLHVSTLDAWWQDDAPAARVTEIP